MKTSRLHRRRPLTSPPSIHTCSLVSSLPWCSGVWGALCSWYLFSLSLRPLLQSCWSLWPERIYSINTDTPLHSAVCLPCVEPAMEPPSWLSIFWPHFHFIWSSSTLQFTFICLSLTVHLYRVPGRTGCSCKALMIKCCPLGSGINPVHGDQTQTGLPGVSIYFGQQCPSVNLIS